MEMADISATPFSTGTIYSSSLPASANPSSPGPSQGSDQPRACAPSSEAQDKRHQHIDPKATKGPLWPHFSPSSMTVKGYHGN